MGDWLLGYFTILGFLGQNWMLVALAIALIWIALLWWSRR
jgi:hypothetical protein